MYTSKPFLAQKFLQIELNLIYHLDANKLKNNVIQRKTVRLNLLTKLIKSSIKQLTNRSL